MDKLVAVIFGDEKTAYAGSRALSEMNAEGSIEVAGMCVIKKEADGTVSTKQIAEDFPFRTLAGTALGSLVGVLGGPAGLAAGTIVGAWAGMFGDLYSAGVDAEFVADVSSAMTPGKCAVLAELEEEWVTPLDTRMESLGGVVYRTLKSTVREEQWKREHAAAKAELDQLKAEFAQARADRKAKLQAQIDKLSKRFDTKLQNAQARAKQISLQYQAKVQALQQRAEKEQGQAKAAVEARIAKLRSDYQSRAHA
jgi:uncharacterized membrane protein